MFAQSLDNVLFKNWNYGDVCEYKNNKYNRNTPAGELVVFSVIGTAICQ